MYVLASLTLALALTSTSTSPSFPSIPDSGGSTGERSPKDAWAQDAAIVDPDKSASDDSGSSSVIILETYGVDPNILRATEGEEGERATHQQESAGTRESTRSSLNLSYLGVSYSESRGSAESDEASSQTDTSTDTLVYEEATRPIGGPVCPIENDTELTQATTHTLTEHSVRELSTQQLQEYNSLPPHYTSSKETLPEYDETTGAIIKFPDDSSDEDDDDTLIRSPTLEDLSSLRESNDSIFNNFQEELERVERQYPNLRPEHLLSEGPEEKEEEEVVLFNPQWVCENIREGSRWSTIIEEREEEEEEEDKEEEEGENSSCGTPNGNLDSDMGQYYSSASGDGGSKSEISGSLASSPRSSEGWRMSMASTATVGSSATAGSDDTVAKDMSELSSVNSRLSYLDEDQQDGKSQSVSTAADSSSTPTKVTQQTDHKRQTSIKDAIDELESIEQAAQTLLQKRQFPGEEDRLTPVSDKESQPNVKRTDSFGKSKDNVSPLSKKKFSQSPPLTRKIIEDHIEPRNVKIESELKTAQFETNTPKTKEDSTFVETKTPASLEPPLVNGNSTSKVTKIEHVANGIRVVKPPLPPTASSQQPKPEIKRRQLSKSKEMQPYISRESYNDERVLKELERLRRSYQESDLNDFFDALENTAISDEIEEAFLRQLLQDISDDVEKSPSESEDSNEIIMTETIVKETKTLEETEPPTEQPNLPSGGSKFERVKERILEMITVRKAGRESGNQDQPITPKDNQSDSSYQVTPQVSRSVTPQSLRADTPDSKSSRSQTPDMSKGEEGKKGFNIAEFLKKGSPKYLRKKYKERKNRKSDLITTSESESEDPDVHKKETDNTQIPKKECQSSLKGSNRSLNSSQELKKEVRFDLDGEGHNKGLEDYNERNTRNNNLKTTVILEEKPKGELIIASPQLITCVAQQQETVILKETDESTQELESDSSLPLPSTVEEINNKTEPLLPKLPERIRPPRRKKKMIPTTVEELSSGDQSDNSASSSSFKGGDVRLESLKSSSATKDESPPPLPPYEEILGVSKTDTNKVEVIEKNESKTCEVPVEVTKIQSPPPPAEFSDSQPPKRPPRSLNPFDSDFSDSEGEVTLDTQETLISRQSPGTQEVLKQDEPAVSISSSMVDVDILVAPIPVTSVASISVAPRPEEAKMMYPPRTLPLPVIQESLHEDQVSLPTPSEPTVSFSSTLGGSVVVEDEENIPSLYDNVNPFKEMLQEISEVNQGTLPDKPADVYPLQKPRNEAMKVENSKDEPQKSVKDEVKVNEQDLPQAACKSPEEKSQVIDFAALEAITAEMFRFTESVATTKKEFDGKSKKVGGKSMKTVVTKKTATSVEPKSKYHGSIHDPAPLTSPRLVQQKPGEQQVVTKDTATGPDTAPLVGSVQEAAKSNTIGIQTDSTRYVRMYEAASQTDTEYETETDFDTESEFEENTKVKYDASKWVFGPAREQTMAQPSTRDPQLQELHKQQQRMIKELQQQKIMQQKKQEGQTSTPSEDKMPLKVVNELKNVLSELDAVTPSPLPAPDTAPSPAPAPARPPPPAVPRKPLEPHLGRDSEKTWQTGAPPAVPQEAVCGGAGQRGNNPPAAPPRKQEASTLFTSTPDRGGGVEMQSVCGLTTSKVRARVYPAFAPVARVPTGKPPVPPHVRRLSADGGTGEDGYQSDPGARRTNGRHKHPPARPRPTPTTSEDRGYATDTELLVGQETTSDKTLRGTWTPLGQPPDQTQPSVPNASQVGYEEVIESGVTNITVAGISPNDPPEVPPPPGGQYTGEDARRLQRLWNLHLSYQQRRAHHDDKRPPSPPFLFTLPVPPADTTCRFDAPTPPQHFPSPPPLPSPPSSPQQPGEARLLAHGASADRGIATAELSEPCQPRITQCGPTQPREPTPCPPHLQSQSQSPERPPPPSITNLSVTPPPLTCDSGTNSQTQHSPTSPPSPPPTRSSSQTVSYKKERLEAEGLAEWVFLARLSRTTKLLSSLPSTMQLQQSINGVEDAPRHDSGAPSG
ncbi:hypothetical protein Pmani_038153 [Petrolisthes manimaculis]|uniref:Uncharacterized protein n=1 Tax=Petrolisthes manimaculis TaxID=1843537 RepID=A0AAE1NGZ0_9EUCA|nr:hypothetical protein Pmani_038153 [Petrolisthes manimaculis]